MSSFSYYNPVKIEFGNDKIEILKDILLKRRSIIVTTEGFIKRGIIDKISSYTDNIVKIISNITPNPTIKDLKVIYNSLEHNSFDTIIAIGGGSVLDSAKVFSVHNNFSNFDLLEKIIKNNYSTIPNYKVKDLIAIPTTAGTGSEVTPWGTVWDMDIKKKYSIHTNDLWAKVCICDPKLTLTLPKDITIQTALDALSHSLESIWNKNSNPISEKFAVESAKEIIKTLPLLINNLDNLEYRKKIMLSALNAGLAFSNTQTSIAHATSYYITANKGIPHGIACSFTLPDIIDTIINSNSRIDNLLTEIFGELSSRKLRLLYEKISISTYFKDYNLTENDLIKIKESIINTPRAKNSIVNLEDLFEKFFNSIF